MLLQNKVAVITGCIKGIGQKTVEVFSENGAKVFACVREISNEFKSTIKDIELKTKNKIIPIQLDLSREDTIKKASDEILSQNDSVDILVNNAGIIHTANFHMTSSEKLKELFDKFKLYLSK
jgi:short-subunit dehydrogenase